MIVEKPLWMWISYGSIILFLLIFDLRYTREKEPNASFKESAILSSVYVGVAFLFGFWLLYAAGPQAFYSYITGYVVEKSLSLDNIFVMSLVFSSLGIPESQQHRVLFWGILGAMAMRALMIGMGGHMIQHFSWMLSVFSIFLVIMGVKMLFFAEKEQSLETQKLWRFLQKILPLDNHQQGQAFFVKKKVKGGRVKYYATPLFLALLMIEWADLIFALDSIPAIFSITTDLYIVYTSNIFAILGLRALYHVLASLLKRLVYLQQTLSMMLIFIGAKEFLAKLIGLQAFPLWLSLSTTLVILSLGTWFSFRAASRRDV